MTISISTQKSTSQFDTMPPEVLDFINEILLKVRNRPANNGEKYVLQGTWAGWTYEEMAKNSKGKYEQSYLSKSAGPEIFTILGEELKITLNKKNFRVVIEKRFKIFIPLSEQQSSEKALTNNQSLKHEVNSKPVSFFEETIDVSKNVFFGRKQELQELKISIHNPDRKVSILQGFAGVGKSSIAYHASTKPLPFHDHVDQKIVEENPFDVVIFTSLRRRRSVVKFIDEILHKSFDDQTFEGAGIDKTEACIDRLIHFLSCFRCLLVIDNFDSVMCKSSDGLIRFIEKSEELGHYDTLVEKIAVAGHKSHLLVICRSFPESYIDTHLSGRPVHQIKLFGLGVEDVEDILKNDKIHFTPDNIKTLTNELGGNPMAIKFVRSEIQNLYQGNLDYYLLNASLPKDLEDYIDKIISSLEEPERRILYRIAVYNRAVTYMELRQDILDKTIIPEKLSLTIESLIAQSLIDLDEKNYYYVHPLVTDISTGEILQQMIDDISEGSLPSLKRFDSYLLIKATADDFDRKGQEKHILEPLVNRLRRKFGDNENIQNKLQCCLEVLQGQPKDCLELNGYAGGNIFNILNSLGTSLDKWDFSNLVLRQADLRGVSFREGKLIGTKLIDCALPEPLGCPDVVVFCPKENKIAIGDADGVVRIWRFDDAGWYFERSFAKEHTGWIWSLAFSPDGGFLVSGGDDGIVRLWHLNSKREDSFWSSNEPHGSIKSVVLSSNFRCNNRGVATGFIAAANDDGKVKFWDAGNLSNNKAMLTPMDLLQGVRIAVIPNSHNTNQFAIATENGQVQLWSFHDNEIEYKDKFECTDKKNIQNKSISALSVCSKGENLLIGTIDGFIGFYKIDVDKLIEISKVKKHDKAVWSIAVSHDTEIIASAGFDNKIVLLKVADHEEIDELIIHKGKVLSVAFNPIPQYQGHHLVSASDDRTVRSWSIIPDTHYLNGWRIYPRHVLEGLTHWIWQISFDKMGEKLAVACDNGKTLLLDFRNNYLTLSTRTTPYFDAVRDWTVSFSPNNEILAIGDSNNNIRLWDCNSSSKFDCLSEHEDSIRDIAFSPDGSILASASADAKVILWDLRELDKDLNKHRRKINLHQNHDSTGTINSIMTLTEDYSKQVWAVTFSCDGRFLASSGEDGKIIVIDFSANGQENDNSLLVDKLQYISEDTDKQSLPNRPKYKLESDLHKKYFGDKRNGITWALTFRIKSELNSLLISAGSDCIIRLWDIKSEECVATLEGHDGHIRALSVSNNGDFLVSSGNDSKIIIWDLRLIEEKSKQKLVDAHAIIKQDKNNGHTNWIWTIANHPTSDIFASASLDGKIKLWNFAGTLISEYDCRPFAGLNIRQTEIPSQQKETLEKNGAE
jgi:WD40 repeat protein